MYRIALVLTAALASGCVHAGGPSPVIQRDMFAIYSIGGYAGYADYLNHQYYAMAGGVPSDLSNEYGKCMNQAYLSELSPDELNRLDAAATGEKPLKGTDKEAFERGFVAHTPAEAMERKIKSLCPETTQQVLSAMRAAGN